MARIGLTSGFTLIPEGEYVFGIYDVTYDETFGKMEVKCVTADGLRHTERFSLKNSNDEINEGAINAFSYLAKVALNNFGAEEIDHTDLIGHYFIGSIVHTQQPNRKDPTKIVTFANLGRDKSPASCFDSAPCQMARNLMEGAGKTQAPAPVAAPVAQTAPQSAPALDLDSLLG